MLLNLPQTVKEQLSVNNWQEQCPRFDLNPVDKKNWPQWCEAASTSMNNLSYALGLVSSTTLEELITVEQELGKYLHGSTSVAQAPEAVTPCEDGYPILLPGNENVLQRKLDVWNRFQLAHGFMPTLARLVVSLGIVGGTIFSGLIG